MSETIAAQVGSLTNQHRANDDTATWPFFRIALLVTGKGEEQFLPRLFRSLELMAIAL